MSEDLENEVIALDDARIDYMSESLFEAMSAIEDATACEKIYSLLEVALAIVRDCDEAGEMMQFLEEAFCETMLDAHAEDRDGLCGVRVH